MRFCPHFLSVFFLYMIISACAGTDESLEELPATERQLLSLNNETLWIQVTTAANPYRIRLRDNLKEGFMIDAQTCEWIKEGSFSYRGFLSETQITEHTSNTLALKINSTNSEVDLVLNYRMQISGNEMDFRLESSLPSVVRTFEGRMLRSEARAQNMCREAN